MNDPHGALPVESPGVVEKAQEFLLRLRNRTTMQIDFGFNPDLAGLQLACWPAVDAGAELVQRGSAVGSV
jgi:hypothetical protein